MQLSHAHQRSLTMLGVAAITLLFTGCGSNKQSTPQGSPQSGGNTGQVTSSNQTAPAQGATTTPEKAPDSKTTNTDTVAGDIQPDPLNDPASSKLTSSVLAAPGDLAKTGGTTAPTAPSTTKPLLLTGGANFTEGLDTRGSDQSYANKSKEALIQEKTILNKERQALFDVYDKGQEVRDVLEKKAVSKTITPEETKQLANVLDLLSQRKKMIGEMDQRSLALEGLINKK